MLACFLIISQVVVIKTEQKKMWAEFHLMTVWVMKINSRRIKYNMLWPYVLKWRGAETGLLVICSAVSPTENNGWGERKDSGYSRRLLRFPEDTEQWTVEQTKPVFRTFPSCVFLLFPLPHFVPSWWFLWPYFAKLPSAKLHETFSTNRILWVPPWPTTFNRKC